MINSVDLENSKAHVIVIIIEYIPGTGNKKTIIKRTTGTTTVLSVIAAEDSAERKSHTDYYIQIITGMPELTINSVLYPLKPGDGIIIPVNSLFYFNASTHFKMILTILKPA